MRFTFPFLKTKKEKPYYFCLYINDHTIDGFVLETIQGSYKIRAEKKRRQSSGFDKILEDTDNLISDLEMKVSGDLSKTIFLKDKNPLDKKCDCYVCQNYKRNYLSHLFRAKEITALKLVSFHNVYFFNTFVENIREKIKNGKL